MKILVDADACPVIPIIEKIAKEKELPLLLFCDTSHILSSTAGKVIVVDKGNDSVDFALISQGNKGDLVVTQDYGVAAMALGKGMYAIHQSGKYYTDETIDQMLFERHLNKKARRSSARFHQRGAKKRTEEENAKFEQAFRKLIHTILDEK